MKELLQNLIQLQSLESAGVKDKKVEASLAELRAKIPPQILAHYDRLVARGKKGLAAVRGQVCSGCHMQVPLGVVMTLKHGEDIQLCESCGRYLYPAARRGNGSGGTRRQSEAGKKKTEAKKQPLPAA